VKDVLGPVIREHAKMGCVLEVQRLALDVVTMIVQILAQVDVILIVATVYALKCPRCHLIDLHAV